MRNGVAALAAALPFAALLFFSSRPWRPAGRIGWQNVFWRFTHWALFFGMLLLPVTRPLLHSSGLSWGFAPILAVCGAAICCLRPGAKMPFPR